MRSDRPRVASKKLRCHCLRTVAQRKSLRWASVNSANQPACRNCDSAIASQARYQHSSTEFVGQAVPTPLRSATSNSTRRHPMSIIKKPARKLRSIFRLLLAFILFAFGSGAVHAQCALEGWPSEVSYAPATDSTGGVLSFWPPRQGLLFDTIESNIQTGDHIDLSFRLLEFCGLGLLPPPDVVRVPTPSLPAGNYDVTVTVNRDPPIAPQTLSFTVAGASTSIPLLSPASTLLILASLLMVGGWVLRKRRRAR